VLDAEYTLKRLTQGQGVVWRDACGDGKWEVKVARDVETGNNAADAASVASKKVTYDIVYGIVYIVQKTRIGEPQERAEKR